MNTPWLASVILAASVPLFGDDPAVVHERSTGPTGSRFEVVQSPLAAKLTFKLDRVTGMTWQMVRANESSPLSWEIIPISGLPRVSATSAPRFQIFMSGLAARYTFLVDTLTGSAWIYTSSGDGKEYSRNWEQMPGEPGNGFTAEPPASGAGATATAAKTGRPVKPTFGKDGQTWGQYQEALAKYETDYEVWLLAETRRQVQQEFSAREKKAAAKTPPPPRKQP